MKQIKFSDETAFDCISVFARKAGQRSIIEIKLNSTYADVSAKFIDNAQYGIVETETVTAEDGTESVVTNTYDKSEYCVAGNITDHRNGAITVIMGKKTEVEILQEQVGVSEQELQAAIERGVNA
ncbi:MAG: hypothetical protein ACOX7J_00260 [Bacillota bacterium]|jgi:hypothetical protein